MLICAALLPDQTIDELLSNFTASTECDGLTLEELLGSKVATTAALKVDAIYCENWKIVGGLSCGAVDVIEKNLFPL